jgi:hypothetical protein
VPTRVRFEFTTPIPQGANVAFETTSGLARLPLKRSVPPVFVSPAVKVLDPASSQTPEPVFLTIKVLPEVPSWIVPLTRPSPDPDSSSVRLVVLGRIFPDKVKDPARDSILEFPAPSVSVSELEI